MAGAALRRYHARREGAGGGDEMALLAVVGAGDAPLGL
jgi:hypothetical protein